MIIKSISYFVFQTHDEEHKENLEPNKRQKIETQSIEILPPLFFGDNDEKDKASVSTNSSLQALLTSGAEKRLETTGQNIHEIKRTLTIY